MIRTILFALLGSALLPAAPITWGPAANTTDKSDLIEGNVVLAVSGGSGATITNGGAGGTSTYTFTGVSYQDLTFDPPPGNRTSGDITNGAASTGDADFDTVVGSFTDTQSGITSGTQTIDGLTPGTQYQLQVFFNDQRGCCRGRTMTFGDSGAGNVDVAAAGSNWGQNAIGTFTADGTTQDLTHATNGFGNVHINALLVTQPGPAPPPDMPTGLAATPATTASSSIGMPTPSPASTSFASSARSPPAVPTPKSEPPPSRSSPTSPPPMARPTITSSPP